MKENRASATGIQLPWVYWVTFLAIFLTACQSHPTLDQVVTSSKLHRAEREAGQFTLLELSGRTGGPGETLHVYLGGDGRPWVDNRPASNPTGLYPLSLELMIQDPAPTVYLGRPCYYRVTMPSQCSPALWTRARYSDTVLDSMAIALTEVIRERRPRDVVLVGYSGGGAIAVLVASKLAEQTPVSVITLAANLDITAWTEHHGLLPLEESRNPATQPDTGLAEVHLLGEHDSVVPVHTVQQYSHRHPGAKFVYVEDFDHRCCWVRYWPDILPGALSALGLPK